MQWNSTLYDQKHDFVAKYGEGLLTFLPENPAQDILDLGCGTGTLTAQLAARGSRVIGVDSARPMVERARAQYPELTVEVCDALALPFEGEFDVVFSNAATTGLPTTAVCGPWRENLPNKSVFAK